MASRQVVLLTPLESSHPQLSPSSHRINLMNTDFPVVDPLYFQTLTTCPPANLFALSLLHFDGGVYPPPPLPFAELTFRRLDVETICKFFNRNTYKKKGVPPSIRGNPVQQFRPSPDSAAWSTTCTTNTTRLRHDIGVGNLSPQDRFPTLLHSCHAETEICAGFGISTMPEVCAKKQTEPQSKTQHLSVQDREPAGFQTRFAGLGRELGNSL
jgi:hypothetical protein